MCGVDVLVGDCWDSFTDGDLSKNYQDWMEKGKIEGQNIRCIPFLNLVPCVVGALIAVVELVIAIAVTLFLGPLALLGSETCERVAGAAVGLAVTSVAFIAWYTWSVIDANIIWPVENLGPGCLEALHCFALCGSVIAGCALLCQDDKT